MEFDYDEDNTGLPLYDDDDEVVPRITDEFGNLIDADDNDDEEEAEEEEGDEIKEREDIDPDILSDEE